MRTYTVHEPPAPPADRIDRAERLVFIEDGFSWTAAFLGPIWMLAHRLWWPLVAFLVVGAAIEATGRLAGLDQRWGGLAFLALNILVGLEADTLRRWTLERRGWRTLGTVSGRTRLECERRFFEAWLPGQPIIAPAGPAATPSAGGRRGWWRLGRLAGARA